MTLTKSRYIRSKMETKGLKQIFHMLTLVEYSKITFSIMALYKKDKILNTPNDLYLLIVRQHTRL